MGSATAGWQLVAVCLCSSVVLCVPLDQTTAATVITQSDNSFGQPDVDGEVVPLVNEDSVNSNLVRRRNGVEMTEGVREEPSSRERLVMQRLGLRCDGGDVLSCFMVQLTDYFDGFMARSNGDLLPGANLSQVSPPAAQPDSSSDEETTATTTNVRSGEDAAPSLLQMLGRKAWALARSYVLSLDLRPVADFVQEVRTSGLLSGLEKAIGAGRSEKLTVSGIELPQLPQLPQFGSSDSGNNSDEDDDDDDDDDDNDKDNSSRTTMTAIVLKTVVLGLLALKAIALLVVKVAVIMKVTAAVAVLALLFFHGFQKDISYQVVTHQNKPDSYEPDPHSHQEEYGGDSYTNNGVGGGGYGGGGAGGGGGYGGNGGGYGGNGGSYGGNGGSGGDWNRNGAAHSLAYRGQRRKQNG